MWNVECGPAHFVALVVRGSTVMIRVRMSVAILGHPSLYIGSYTYLHLILYFVTEGPRQSIDHLRQ